MEYPETSKQAQVSTGIDNFALNIEVTEVRLAATCCVLSILKINIVLSLL